jgi:ketosteroid isomerase-like protein
VISDGDQVAALGWYSGTYKQTGRSFRARFAHWYTVTDGKIARFEQVADTSKVNEAL